ncbi:solute carrier family 35 member G1 [Schistocerca serialis cubense]|uniref:solute carrier family 35 member G1 n=1 Tax=Schistocerca serialis cubense TaxID=2023355 RepID=UPI00214F5467|nr:solute carrier family 35 member G1 [Schistocerca serialis cubense]
MPEQLELQQLVEADDEAAGRGAGAGGQTPPSPSPSASASQSSGPGAARCPYLGLVLATLSSLLFSLCSVIVKWLVEVHPMQLAACRFAGVLLPALPIVLWRAEPVFPRGRRLMLLLRSFVGTTGLMLSFYAFRHMPLADASVVVFSVPVFVAIFARLFLKEPCGPFHALTIALTLVGVVLITRPPLLFGHAAAPPLGAGGPVESDAWGAAAAFAATLFGANAYVLLRALKGLHFAVVMCNFGAFALVQTTLVAAALGALCMPRCGFDRFLVVALALLSFGGQILLTMSLQLEQAGPVAIARSADIVFAFIWQLLFFKEVPNRYSVMGAVLVTCSVLLTGLRRWALALPEASPLRRRLGLLAR